MTPGAAAEPRRGRGVRASGSSASDGWDGRWRPARAGRLRRHRLRRRSRRRASDFASETVGRDRRVAGASWAAASDVVITMVAERRRGPRRDARRVGRGRRAAPLIDSLRPGSIVIDMSSSAPDRHAAARCGCSPRARSPCSTPRCRAAWCAPKRARWRSWSAEIRRRSRAAVRCSRRWASASSRPDRWARGTR